MTKTTSYVEWSDVSQHLPMYVKKTLLILSNCLQSQCHNMIACRNFYPTSSIRMYVVADCVVEGITMLQLYSLQKLGTKTWMSSAVLHKQTTLWRVGITP